MWPLNGVPERVDARRLTFAVGPVAAAAGLGGLGARGAPQTYRRLRKPPWAPPPAVFGPVWSLLYIAIGTSGWRLFTRASAQTRSLHVAQMALNTAWPVAFFGVRDKRASLVIISMLDVALTAEVLRLRREDPIAAYLLVPYLGWVAFATALNAAVSDPGERD
jgi:benzodiazapine receptor